MTLGWGQVRLQCVCVLWGPSMPIHRDELADLCLPSYSIGACKHWGNANAAIDRMVAHLRRGQQQTIGA